MRVFIAIPVSPDVKAKLIDVQQEFRRLSVEATWVREAGFHLTLKFLGEVDRNQIDPIACCMTEASGGFEPFSATACGMGVFPHPSRPRVLWAGIQDGTEQLIHLQHTLETSLARQRFPLEDGLFRPHLTLARLRRSHRWEDFMACVIRHQADTFGSLTVDHLELIESQLHPTGARYSTIKAVRFHPLDGI